MSDRDLNIGHGHVFPRPDGRKARCGGPAICAQCALDLASKDAAERERSWQPIDTAPRDGTWLLAWNGTRPSVVTWVDPYYEGGPGEWVTDAMRRCDPPLTHWMTLPGAPE